jgi:hypothetical protein
MLTEAGRIHDRAWATQCALSRICAGCAMSLGRPIAFVGTSQERARNEFHLPPMHVDCAEELLGAPGADPGWSIVPTAGFEFVRPSKEDLDPRPRFVPNSLL